MKSLLFLKKAKKKIQYYFVSTFELINIKQPLQKHHKSQGFPLSTFLN